MKRDSYEADKNDIIVDFKGLKMNLTANWDGSVDQFMWSPDGKNVYFVAAVDGTKQLFVVNFPGMTRIAVTVRQITNGDFDVSDIIGFSGDQVLVTRTDMNHAAEIFSYNLKKNIWKQLSNVNTATYNTLSFKQNRTSLCYHNRWQKNVGLDDFTSKFRCNKKISNVIILPRWTTISLNTKLFFSLEFLSDGSSRLCSG